MSLTRLNIMYGHLEGTEGKFARDPSGYLSIESGIYQKHGLEVSWNHVQGTEERYRRLEDGSAQISLVVGRASLQHFLDSRTTRILGSAMNSCPYYLIVNAAIRELGDLKGKTIVCREGPSRNTPIAKTFREQAQLRVGEKVTLQLPGSDQEAYPLYENSPRRDHPAAWRKIWSLIVFGDEDMGRLSGLYGRAADGGFQTAG